ncbi:MAG: SDR family oxidoreductase [Acidimicrobiia bacterium]|nr:SDR family oxidoreductase [Acidimicrobiia bacterium]
MINLGLEGQRALVTGAAVGIGRSVAMWLADAGCDVALVDKDAESLEQACAEVAATGRKAHAIAIDLRDEASAAQLVDDTVAALGGLDIAVNNVGSLGGREPAAFIDQDADYLHDVVAQNLFVTVWCCRAEARAMLAAKTAGVIVNVSSGETTRPAVDLAAYGAAKAAINHLTQTLATELGPHGIRVNAVAPGTTLTPTVRDALSDDYVARLVESIPLQRMNEPDDLARLVVALASDLGRGVTGQLVLSDNGAHLSRNRPFR